MANEQVTTRSPAPGSQTPGSSAPGSKGGGSKGHGSKAPGSKAPGSEGGVIASSGMKWGEVWQVPVLLASVLLLAVGWYLARPAAPKVDYAGKLVEANHQIDAGQFDQANATLNKALNGYDKLTVTQKIAYHLSRGDAFVGGMKTKGARNPVNHKTVIEHYRQAEQLGHKLDDARIKALATSYTATGQTGEAEKLTQRISKANQKDREQLLVEAIGPVIDDPSRYDEAVRQLTAMLGDGALSRARRIWAVGQMAELRRRGGQVTAADAGSAAELLLRWLVRLDATSHSDTAPLLVQLGKAYLELGQRGEAERRFMQARQQLQPSDPVAGEALVGLGRVRFEEDNIVEALEHFSDAVSRYPGTACFFDALLGQAECEARMGDWGDSLASYDQAISMAGSDLADSPRFRRLAESLTRQSDWRYDKRDFATALKYSELAMKLHGKQTPVGVVLKLANEHEQIARGMLGLGEGQLDTSREYQKLDPAQRGEVSMHYEKAGDLYGKHAAMAAQSDDRAHGESLWRSADCYDKAGMRQLAIAQFNQYMSTRPEDPRQLQVRYRLAQAYQADAQFDRATDLYRGLIENHPKSPEAYDALVPLARCYLAKGSETWDRAEQVLLSVVTDNEALRPESRQYHEALIELGELYYRRGGEGDYERAIERLSEATRRYGDDAQLPDLQFRLGDAYRKSVQQIDRKLAEPQSPSQRAKYQQERATRLADAQNAFDRVIDAYEKVGAAKLSPIQKLYLRNSYFYRADCAYNLRHYEGTDGAIALYDQAAAKYESDPSVLIAMIQIVNSYCELGQWDMARTVNERAKWYLSRIKDEAFNDPNLPMTRKQWQRWLDWTSELNAKRPPAPGSVPAPGSMPGSMPGSGPGSAGATATVPTRGATP
ncbi:MAG: tetratricopeptide repeat protein [Phycisphaerales bacterium]